MPCEHSTVIDCASCAQDAFQPTAVDACGVKASMDDRISCTCSVTHKLCGNCRGFNPHLMSSSPLVVLVYLSLGSDVTPQIALKIFVCYKKVKNTQFSCQYMGFLKLEMHQNTFSDGHLHQLRLGELTTLCHTPQSLVYSAIQQGRFPSSLTPSRHVLGGHL